MVKQFINTTIHRAKKSLLVKTSIFNGIATFIRIIVGIVSTKVVAVILGPSGVAILGNFNNIFGIISNFGSGGINNGVTKYVAEYKGTTKIKDIYSNSVLITFITSVFTSLFILFFKNYLSAQIFYDISYSWIFIVLAFSLPFITFKSLFSSLMTGYKELNIIIITNIVFSIMTLVITILMVWKFHLIGAVLAIIISGLLTSFVIYFMFLNAEWHSELEFSFNFNKEICSKFFKFSLMVFVSMFFASFIQLMLRKYIISSISMDTAGQWQAVTSVTELFISMFTMTLSIYFLPRFSEIIDNKELKKEIKKAICFISPPLILGLFSIYLLRNFVILTLFSEKFLPMEPLFLFQLIGSYFKVISWVLGYLLIAKAMTRMFIFTEIIFGSSYYLLFILFTTQFSIIGATYAFAFNYLLYLLFLVGYFGRVLNYE